jgi:hypothetical protein
MIRRLEFAPLPSADNLSLFFFSVRWPIVSFIVMNGIFQCPYNFIGDINLLKPSGNFTYHQV